MADINMKDMQAMANKLLENASLADKARLQRDPQVSSVQSGWWGDVYRVLNKASTDFWGTPITHPDINITFFKPIRDKYGLGDLLDYDGVRVVKDIAILSDTPKIRTVLYKRCFYDRGLLSSLLEFSDGSKLQFAISTFLLMNHKEQFLLTRKGDLLPTVLKLNRAVKAKKTAIDKPILPDDIINKVVANTIGIMRKAEKLKDVGVKARRGFIIQGPPGNGKSMLCNYIGRLAKEHNITFTTTDSSKLEGLVANGKAVEAFSQEGIHVLDDIDTKFLAKRNSGNSTQVAALLSALDGGDINRNNRVVILTTNERLDDMDPAIIRPGRIDFKLRIDKPSKELRAKYITTWNDTLISKEEKQELIDTSDDYSFASLNLIRSILATAKIIDEKPVTLNEAIEIFTKESTQIDKRPTVGFCV